MQNLLIKSVMLSATLLMSMPALAASDKGTANSKADPSASAYEHANCNASFQSGCAASGKDKGKGNAGSGTVIGASDSGSSNTLPGPEMHSSGPALLALACVMFMLRRRNSQKSNLEVSTQA